MPDPFVLPAELQLSTSEGVLILRYPGDVVLDQDLGMDTLDIEVGGNLEVRLPQVSGRLRAGGTLKVVGEIDGGHMHGREIVLGDADVQCDALDATERIEIGPASLHVDVIIAPTIDIDPDATGRVTVIESRNERGPTKIKGGFSLQEYEELLGNANAFLSERGLEPLDGGEVIAKAKPAKGRAPRKGTPPVPAPPPPRPSRRVIPEDDDSRHDAPTVSDEMDEEPPSEAADMDDPLSLSTDELALEEVPDANVSEAIDEELQRALQDAVDRIVGCYTAGEVPPPVEDLQALVAAGDYAMLRAKITLVWSGLLGYHQKRGIRPHHQVTHAFNVIHGLLQPA